MRAERAQNRDWGHRDGMLKVLGVMDCVVNLTGPKSPWRQAWGHACGVILPVLTEVGWSSHSGCGHSVIEILTV